MVRRAKLNEENERARPESMPLHQAVSISLLSTVVLVTLLVVLVTLNCPLPFMFGQNADEDGVCVISYKRQELAA
jgi:hypothetical protein